MSDFIEFVSGEKVFFARRYEDLTSCREELVLDMDQNNGIDPEEEGDSDSEDEGVFEENACATSGVVRSEHVRADKTVKPGYLEKAMCVTESYVAIKVAQRQFFALCIKCYFNHGINLPVGKRETQTYQSWENLWYPNFEDYNKAEAAVGYENNTVTNVTVQLGAIAYLHCYVRSLPDRALVGTEQVSWIRRRDWHILSSGVFTYTNDERFQILHGEGSDDWTLQIKYVQKRDNGTYECQISSSSHGLLSHFVNLQIVVPEATIQGSKAGEHHVDVGSIIDLVCIIDKSPTPPQYVFWYHNDRMINYDTARGGIFVETTPGFRTQTRLTIRDTTDADSGNYTCSASNTESASIYVFVSEGDNVDAILMRKSCAMCMASQIFTILLTTLMAAVR